MDEYLALNEAIAQDQDPAQEEIVLATVTAVGADGVQILPDGATESGGKDYKVNAAQKLQVGDRVKIFKNSGTYIVEYVIGVPMSRYPIPSGGSDGQVLVKDGANAYQVKWASVEGLPSGGSTGDVLVKTSSGYGWAAKGLPGGGTSGQVLAKTGAADYAASWQSIGTVPATGTTGYVLTKTASGNEWAAIPTPEVSKLVNGTRELQLSSGGAVTGKNTTTNITLGSSSIPIAGCYLNGEMHIGTGSTSSTKLGFFGTGPVAKQTVASSATVATLITALKNYGLV